MSTEDDKKILEGMKDKISFIPIDDRILIKPLKTIKVKRRVNVPVDEKGKVVPTEKIDPVKNYKTKTVTRSENSNMSKGIVLKIGRTGSVTNIPFEEGDTIVFKTGTGQPFELFKDTVLLKRYEILGIWSD